MSTPEKKNKNETTDNSDDLDFLPPPSTNRQKGDPKQQSLIPENKSITAKPPSATASKESFTPPIPNIAVSPEVAARRQAAARAYALSTTNTPMHEIIHRTNQQQFKNTTTTQSQSQSQTKHPSQPPTSSVTTASAYIPPKSSTPTKPQNVPMRTIMPTYMNINMNMNMNAPIPYPAPYYHPMYTNPMMHNNMYEHTMQPHSHTSHQEMQQRQIVQELMDVGDDEYANFMRSIMTDDIMSLAYSENEDDEDFKLEEEEEEEEEDENEQDIVKQEKQRGDSLDSSSQTESLGIHEDDFLLDPLALEEELGGLLEEDMEAAVNSLIQQEESSVQEHPLVNMAPLPSMYASPQKLEKIASPISKNATKVAKTALRFPTPTQQQVLKLQALMNQHYQIAIQGATLAARSAHRSAFASNNTSAKNGKRKRIETYFCSGENGDDLAGILDGAVTMLQDLDKNRKDAIRYAIQMRRIKARMDATEPKHGFYPSSAPVDSRNTSMYNHHGREHSQQGILTRSAFSRTLMESDMLNPEYGTVTAPVDHSTGVSESSNSMLGAATVFGVKGLARLNETFAVIDNSLSEYSNKISVCINAPPLTRTTLPIQDSENIFLEPRHGRACELLLNRAKADYNKDLIPEYKDLATMLTYPAEVDGGENGGPLNENEQLCLRQNKHQFTAAEDNLILRGVNIYGEKEWVLIADRFLPDRTVSAISQRYWRLCLLIYKGHGIQIDEKGNLIEGKATAIEDFNETLIKKTLKAVTKPAVFGLYRWSMEEDILLLKAVPLMGRMFAEIGKRFIPYRDRGALRKRYQVLERRVKSVVKRDKKYGINPKAKKILLPKVGSGVTVPKAPIANKTIARNIYVRPTSGAPPITATINKTAPLVAQPRPQVHPKPNPQQPIKPVNPPASTTQATKKAQAQIPAKPLQKSQQSTQQPVTRKPSKSLYSAVTSNQQGQINSQPQQRQPYSQPQQGQPYPQAQQGQPYPPAQQGQPYSQPQPGQPYSQHPQRQMYPIAQQGQPYPLAQQGQPNSGVHQQFFPRPQSAINFSVSPGPYTAMMRNSNGLHPSTVQKRMQSSAPTHAPTPAPAPTKGKDDSYSAFKGVIEGEYSAHFSSEFQKKTTTGAEYSNFPNFSKLLASSPSRTNAHQPSNDYQFLPSMDYNNNSLSGFSVLDGAESNLVAPSNNRKEKIFDSVLSRAAKESPSFNRKLNSPSKSAAEDLPSMRKSIDEIDAINVLKDMGKIGVKATKEQNKSKGRKLTFFDKAIGNKKKKPEVHL